MTESGEVGGRWAGRLREERAEDGIIQGEQTVAQQNMDNGWTRRSGSAGRALDWKFVDLSAKPVSGSDLTDIQLRCQWCLWLALASGDTTRTPPGMLAGVGPKLPWLSSTDFPMGGESFVSILYEAMRPPGGEGRGQLLAVRSSQWPVRVPFRMWS